MGSPARSCALTRHDAAGSRGNVRGCSLASWPEIPHHRLKNVGELPPTETNLGDGPTQNVALRSTLAEGLGWLKANPPLKVISVYVAGSLAGLGQVDLVTARLGAPDWVFAGSAVVAALGLFVVVVLAASLKRGVTLKRFLGVLLGGMLLGWVAVFVIDVLHDRDMLPPFVYGTAVFVWLFVLPFGLSAALLWPLRQSPSCPPSVDAEGAT